MYDIQTTPDTPTSPENATQDISNSLRRKRQVRIRSERVYDAEGRMHNVVKMVSLMRCSINLFSDFFFFLNQIELH